MKSAEPSTAKKHQLDRMWDSIQEHDVKVYGPWWLRPYPEVLEWAKELPKNGVVLNIGCGMGNHTIALAKQGFEVVAFDASPQAVKTTKDWLKKEHRSATVTCNDFMAFDYGTERFDGILSMNVIHHGTEEVVQDVIRNIYQSLKPGGFFLATVPPKTNLKSYKQIANNTFVPIDGSEKGIKHVLFTEALIEDMFSCFTLEPMRRDHIENFVISGRKP